jgi:hypothetical protein
LGDGRATASAGTTSKSAELTRRAERAKLTALPRSDS